MKKIIALFLALAMVFSLCACGSTADLEARVAELEAENEELRQNTPASKDETNDDESKTADTGDKETSEVIEEVSSDHPRTVDEFLTNFEVKIEEAQENAKDSEEYSDWAMALTIPTKEELESSDEGLWYGIAQVKSLMYMICFSTETDDIDSQLLGVGIQIPANAVEGTTLYAVMSLIMMTVTSFDKTFTNDDAARLVNQLMEEGRPLKSNGVRWNFIDDVEYDNLPNEPFLYYYGELLEMQSNGKTTSTSPVNTPVTDKPSSTSATTGEKNALKSAKDYLSVTSFSYTGLIEQLEYEGYSESEAKYGADNCGADWNEQAAKAAKQYLEISSFSRSALIEQLIYEGYTQDQAEYGVTQAGY